MKNLLYVFLIVFFITVGGSFKEAQSDDLLTRNQAIAILIEQVISPEVYEDYYMAFGPQNMLTDGDSVEPAYSMADPFPVSGRNIQNPTWFFWIDTDKWAKFVHLVHFVYIDASQSNPTIGDGIVVESQGWWPKINGVDYLSNSEERWASADIVYGEAPTAPPTIPPREGNIIYGESPTAPPTIPPREGNIIYGESPTAPPTEP